MKGGMWLSIVNHVLDEKGYFLYDSTSKKMSSKYFYKHSILCRQLSGKNTICFTDSALLLV